jgi:hypothetical protein
MEALGRWLAGISWIWLLVIWVGFLGLVWLIILPFKKMHEYRGQLLILAAILWMGIIFYLISFSFPVPAPFLNIVTNAATIPRVWVAALIPVVIITLIPILRRKMDADPKWGNIKLVGMVLGSLFISIALFGVVGYYVSSAAFILACMWLLGSRSWIELTAVPVGWVLFSYFIFARLLNVRLPVGSIFSSLMGGA